MLEFYMLFARKIFSRFFFWGGGHCSPSPVSYAYVTVNWHGTNGPRGVYTGCLDGPTMTWGVQTPHVVQTPRVCLLPWQVQRDANQRTFQCQPCTAVFRTLSRGGPTVPGWISFALVCRCCVLPGILSHPDSLCLILLKQQPHIHATIHLICNQRRQKQSSKRRDMTGYTLNGT